MLFRFCDETGTERATINECDITKRVPPGFELKRPAGKKTKTPPCILLFRTQECDPKLSFYLESYATLTTRAWIKSGWSVEKVQLSGHQSSKDVVVATQSADVSISTDWEQLFRSTTTRIGRAQDFLTLDGATQRAFFLLPVAEQMRLLFVSTKTASQFRRHDFTFEKLLEYVTHVATTKTRREQEKQAKRYAESQANEKWSEKLMRERIALMDDTLGVIDAQDTTVIRPGISQYTNVVERDRDVFDFYGLALHSEWNDEDDGTPSSFAEERLQTRYNVTIKHRVTGNDLRRTFRLIDGIEDAWWNKTLNSNVLHLIYYWYSVIYIRRQRLSGERVNLYTTFGLKQLRYNYHQDNW